MSSVTEKIVAIMQFGFCPKFYSNIYDGFCAISNLSQSLRKLRQQNDIKI